jgi:2-desacetyl-2-hydroxyethyl bacteriochlorophyllide A dehydrogenase
MKAMVLKGPRELKLETIERPVPVDDQVLVQVRSSGICGTDLKIYEGAIPVQYPRVMGHELCGVLVEGGDQHIRTGDRVMVDPSIYCGVCFCCRAGDTSICPHGGLLGRDSNGGFAEYVAVSRRQIFSLPATIGDRQAPLIQVATTCLHGQRRLDIFPGQSVIVLGLGVSGQLHVQLAKARGAHPLIGITRSAWKRDLAEKLGADITLPSGPEAERAVLEATNGRGADVVIECTGKLPAVASAIAMACRGAQLLLFGIITTTDGTLPFYQLYFKELTIVNSRAAKSEDFPAMIALAASRAVNLEALVTHVVPLSDLGTALRMLESDADERMKIILDNTKL